MSGRASSAARRAAIRRHTDIPEQSLLAEFVTSSPSSKGFSNTSVQRPSRKVTSYTVRTFSKAPYKAVSNQSSRTTTGTKVLKQNHFESDSVGKRATAWGTYLHDAQRSWCDRIWEVATWGRDTEREDRRRNSQNHCHGLSWSAKHMTTQVSDYRNKKG